MAFSSSIIAATPRSGSTLLCDLLSETGIAGQPHSYYRRQDILDYARKWGMSSPEVIGDEAFERTYLAAVRRAGAAQAGVFGLRLMWSTVSELSARLSTIHPDPLDDAARFELAFGKPSLHGDRLREALKDQRRYGESPERGDAADEEQPF